MILIVWYFWMGLYMIRWWLLLPGVDLDTWVVVEILKRLKHRIASVSIYKISWKRWQFVNLLARLHELWQFNPGYSLVYYRGSVGFWWLFRLKHATIKSPVFVTDITTRSWLFSGKQTAKTVAIRHLLRGLHRSLLGYKFHLGLYHFLKRSRMINFKR